MIISITEYELLKHQDKLKREVAIEFIKRVSVYGFDRIAAARAAEISRVLGSSGKRINENDILIAGIALANNEILLTRDKKFERIESGNIKVIE